MVGAFASSVVVRGSLIGDVAEIFLVVGILLEPTDVVESVVVIRSLFTAHIEVLIKPA